eukprot:TRINITY_DN5364_c0_g4_i1.p1 TRINITY_DN5364_c0_g4~~TRINITY_DN5364_c0_g4_i1.p1  ORF type:complete len:807 (-),score=162.10 TRINITY_DN5364_c0_g4_i1:122-2542(-)
MNLDVSDSMDISFTNSELHNTCEAQHTYRHHSNLMLRSQPGHGLHCIDSAVMPLITPRRQLTRKYVTKPKVGFGEAVTHCRPLSNIETYNDLKLTIKETAKSVNLAEMKLKAFPVRVLQLQHLRLLSLNYNLISTIPDEIVSLAELETLDLSHNELRTINESIANLKELRFLRLNSNRLIEWPAWLCSELSLLRLFHLHDNPNIQRIPITFSHMKALVQFSFDWFIYIQPSLGTILKNRDLIEQTRTCCRQSQAKSISFFDFYRFFTKARSKNAPNFQLLLHVACKLGHPYIAVALMKLGVSINTVDVEGHTPFSLAVKHQRIECAKILLECRELDVNLAKTNTLHLSIESERYDIAEGIIEHPSADIAARDDKGNTALHLLFAKFDSYPLLIQRLCSKMLNRSEVDPNLLNNEGFSPLHLAVYCKQYRGILFAIEHNSKAEERSFDFLKPGGEEEMIPLHEITTNFDLEVTFEVLGQDLDVLRRDHMGRTPKHVSRDGTTTKLLIRKEKQIIARRMFKRGKMQHAENSSVRDDTQREKEEDESTLCLRNLKVNKDRQRKTLYISYQAKKLKDKKLKSYTEAMFSKIVSRYNIGLLSTNDSEKAEQSIVQRKVPVFSHKSILSKSTERLKPKESLITTGIKSVFNVKITSESHINFYKIITNGRLDYWLRYRIIFNLFKARSSASQAHMKLLVKSLSDLHPLKADLVYLLGVTGGCKGMSLDSVSEGNRLLSKELGNIHEMSLYLDNEYETIRSETKPTKSKKHRSAFNCYSNMKSMKMSESMKSVGIPSLKVKCSYLYFNNEIHP